MGILVGKIESIKCLLYLLLFCVGLMATCNCCCLGKFFFIFNGVNSTFLICLLPGMIMKPLLQSFLLTFAPSDKDWPDYQKRYSTISRVIVDDFPEFLIVAVLQIATHEQFLRVIVAASECF